MTVELGPGAQHSTFIQSPQTLDGEGRLHSRAGGGVWCQTGCSRALHILIREP